MDGQMDTGNLPWEGRDRQEWLLPELCPSLPPSLQKYLHESRHRHAMARKRGEGGRFFSPKEKDSPHMQVSGAGGNPLPALQDTHQSCLCCFLWVFGLGCLPLPASEFFICGPLALPVFRFIPSIKPGNKSSCHCLWRAGDVCSEELNDNNVGRSVFTL